MNNREISLLIVEDESVVRSLLMMLLGERFRCQEADAADGAIRLLESQFFDIVLADVGLPGTSGLDLCRSIRRSSPRTLVVLVSGKNDKEAAEEAKRAGAFDFLSKPFEIDDLIAVVERATAHLAARSISKSAM